MERGNERREGIGPKYSARPANRKCKEPHFSRAYESSANPGHSGVHSYNTWQIFFLPLSVIYLRVYFLSVRFPLSSLWPLVETFAVCRECVLLDFMTNYHLAPQHLHADPCPSVSRTTLFKHLSAKCALVVMWCRILTG